MEYPDSDRSEVVNSIPAGVRRLLDVGCWQGAFGHGLKLRNPELEVWGIEPESHAAQAASSRLDRVIVGTFPPDEDVGQFDCITFLDVLEHMVDPWEALRTAHRYLESGGCVVASIPNVRHFWVVNDLVRRGGWTYQDEGLLDRTHLRFFTKASMMALFQGAGFQIESVRAANFVNVGRADRLFRLAGSRAEEFRALHYILVGRSAAHASP